MKIAMITAGAAGMYCGSCMHDNTLAAELIREGHEALLIPTYTPISTDEADVSYPRVFFGGINVYLQHKSWLFRHTPWLIDRLWDIPRLLRWVSRFAVRTQAEQLGDLTLSMLDGTHGKQRKEVEKLVHWLQTEVRPEIITLTNVLLSGVVPELKARLGVPILATLQGDDIFLEALPDNDRRAAIARIQENCRSIDGYLVTSRYYADFMADYLGLPRQQMHVVYPGLNLEGHGSKASATPKDRPLTIGYFARICPEKGLHLLIDAYRLLAQRPGMETVRLKISGWLGEYRRAYLHEQFDKLRRDGLADRVEYVDSPRHADKVRFLQSIDVLSVPTVYREPKGLYLLEAWANGVPVVQPGHGSFPELIEATQGGLLVAPNSPTALADGLERLLRDADLRRTMGQRGNEAVRTRFHAAQMAKETIAVLQQYLLA